MLANERDQRLGFLPSDRRDRPARARARDTRWCAGRRNAARVAARPRARAPRRGAAARRGRPIAALRDGAAAVRARSRRRDPPKSAAASARGTDGNRRGFGCSRRGRTNRACAEPRRRARPRQALRRACRDSARRRSAASASPVSSNARGTSSRSSTGLSGCSTVGDARAAPRRRKPGRRGSERHAHDVADRELESPGVVGQRQVEARGANRRQRVNDAHEASRAASADARATARTLRPVALDAVLHVADRARKNETQSRRTRASCRCCIAAENRVRRRATSASGKPSNVKSVRTRRCSAR